MIQFLDELLRWNKRINLTSIRNRDDALEKHLLDSLVLLGCLPLSGRLLDMGSGGGLPGIPLAISRPGLQVVSVDGVGKKINFQKHIKRLLALANFQPVHSRLEEVGDLDPFDFVTARALSDFSTLMRLSAPLLKKGGEFLVMKGPEGEAELEECIKNGDSDLFQVKAIRRYRLPFSCSERQLIVLTKKNGVDCPPCA